MAERAIRRDPRLDDPSFSAVQRAYQIRTQHGHPLIVPETLVLGIVKEPLMQAAFGNNLLNEASLTQYVANIRHQEVPQVDEDILWDQEVEGALKQAQQETFRRNASPIVDVRDFYNNLLLTDRMMDYRFSQSVRVQVEIELFPNSKRRRYSFT